MSGRYAPSPTGDLHLGNLRTAAVAWLAARSTGLGFALRIDDLDRARSTTAFEHRQLADLAAIGLDWDGPVVRQSERFHHYEAAIDRLERDGRVYECFCTRREIRAEIEAAPSAPHLPPGSYPGTCRDLTRAKRDALVESGRTPALRLRTEQQQVAFTDLIVGVVEGGVDDFVLRRNDGTPAYNLAVVIDDAEQSITQVVRGDDLLDSTPRQVLLQTLLGLSTPAYAHVPLVIDEDGRRLAKRDGPVTLVRLRDAGVSEAIVVAWIARSLALGDGDEPIALRDVVEGFDMSRVPREPVSTPRLT